MTNEQINIAIAEACPTIVGLGADGIYYLQTGLVEFDPCNDLNAMHDAEKVLTNRTGYTIELENLCKTNPVCRIIWDIATATAAQRAEAFLRTIGKWEGE